MLRHVRETVGLGNGLLSISCAGRWSLPHAKGSGASTTAPVQPQPFFMGARNARGRTKKNRRRRRRLWSPSADFGSFHSWCRHGRKLFSQHPHGAASRSRKPPETVNCDSHPSGQQHKKRTAIDFTRLTPTHAARHWVPLKLSSHIVWCIFMLPTTRDHGENVLHGDSRNQEHAHLLTPIMECHIRSFFNGSRPGRRVGRER